MGAYMNTVSMPIQILIREVDAEKVNKRQFKNKVTQSLLDGFQPKHVPGVPHMVRLQFQLPVPIAKRLVLLAKQANISVSTLCRQILGLKY